MAHTLKDTLKKKYGWYHKNDFQVFKSEFMIRPHKIKGLIAINISKIQAIAHGQMKFKTSCVK